MNSQFIIETNGLSKSYKGGVPIFSGVDVQIKPRERVALIGSNGAGKSTFLKCMIGLHPVTGGSVTTLGETFETEPSLMQRRRLRGQIGFVFQYHGLVKRLSVLSNVVHGMLGNPGCWRAIVQTTAPKAWRERAMEALSAVKLSDKALMRADSLSGGQQQRVAVARALVRNPNLLIADEPAASLDPAAGRDVMEVFSGLAQQHGITLLYTSHDMDHAVQFSDRIIALKGGGLYFDRPSNQVTTAMLKEVFDA